MNKVRLPVMSVSEYKNWIKKPIARQASLPDFFNNGGVERTINVLEGDAINKSVTRWKSFGARHYAAYKENPTFKRAVALRNWGFKVRVPKK